MGQKAGSAAINFATGNIFGGIMDSMSFLFEAIKGVNAVIDQRHESEIRRQLASIETLGRAYEELEKSIDGAYNSGALADYNKRMAENIELQKAAYTAAIAAEEAKKNTDEDRLQELRDEYKAVEEAWEEFKESQLEEMGGTTDYRDATSGFVDAWRDAFKETGNGLDGLKENFTEFFADVVKQQALTQGATNIMQRLFDEINKSLETDYTISDEEYKNIDAVQERVLKDLDAFLKGYYSRYGEILDDTEGVGLTQLQKGIQGITEDTAQVIESYLNSVRFYVESISRDTASCYEQVKDMNALLKSVRTNNGSGFGFRVFVDKI
jgi:predicted  nucleic acid-binding Zn-ribbon protein